MNLLAVLFLAAAASCSSGHLLGYPGLYGYTGTLGAYPGLLGHHYLGATPYAAPGYVTLKGAPVATLPYAPAVAPVAPVAPVQSQYHSQDELGQYSFGYAGGPSSRAETRDAYGIVRGSYNYVDAEGNVQTQHYVADALGYRVSGTNLPVAPGAPTAPALAAPKPVKDTPEVAAAKAAFQKAFDEAAAAAAAAPDSRKKRSVVTPPAAFPYGLPFHYPFGVSLPYPYGATLYSSIFTPYGAAPTPLRDATLTRVVHNPGHAVSYRVD